MDGFVELESDAGHGLVWVRLAHITGIRLLEIRDITGVTHHTVSALAGGEWFSDPVDHPTAAAAAARADELAGVTPPAGLVARVRGAWRAMTTPSAASVRGGRTRP